MFVFDVFLNGNYVEIEKWRKEVKYKKILKNCLDIIERINYEK